MICAANHGRLVAPLRDQRASVISQIAVGDENIAVVGYAWVEALPQDT